MDRDAILQKTKEFTNEMAKNMLLDDPDYRTDVVDGDLTVYITFSGEKMGFMIGPRGRFLQSFQFIISSFLRKNFPEDKISVIVDAGGYLADKMKRIEEYALSKADDARVLGDDMDLEPMSPFERKIVHSVLSKFDDIKTESFGEGEDRYVRIIIVKDNVLGIEEADSILDDKIEE